MGLRFDSCVFIVAYNPGVTVLRSTVLYYTMLPSLDVTGRHWDGARSWDVIRRHHWTSLEWCKVLGSSAWWLRHNVIWCWLVLSVGFGLLIA